YGDWHIADFAFAVSFSYFFFQAEDGIRYRSVTGVQTCALPISLLEKLTPSLAIATLLKRDNGVSSTVLSASLTTNRWPVTPTNRSEERRVGKERRSRSSTERTKQEQRSRR